MKNTINNVEIKVKMGQTIGIKGQNFQYHICFGFMMNKYKQIFRITNEFLSKYKKYIENIFYEINGVLYL